LQGTIHEVGHALYEQGRNESFHDLPVSEPLGMAVHESQSLFYERMISQSSEFCEWIWPKLQNTFPNIPADATADMYYRALNRVQPSLIRVEADEVTYPLHVVLRFEIECGLFDGSIAVEELPRVWNEKIQEYLGIEVPTDREGVLQDVHWSDGMQ